MLRKVRIITEGIFFILITLLFLDFTGTLHSWFGWMAKIQLLPAILALNIVVIIVLVLLTLVFGRIYCSVICPLGVFQDIVSWSADKAKKKRRFSYSPAKSWWRYAVLVLLIVAFVLGLGSLVALLDPYAAYGRMANNFLTPAYQWGNNLLAYLSERMESYAFYPVDVWIRSSFTFAIAVVTFLAVGYLAWRNGRTYCNTICPVGTVLGFLSRFSILRPVINSDKCVKCNKCVRNCKSACIDLKSYNIDYSRCVTCMNCIGSCKFDALHYKSRFGSSSPSHGLPGKAKKSDSTPQIEQDGFSRRNFLSLATLLTVNSAVKAQESTIADIADGGLADIEAKKRTDRAVRIVPPGALSIRNFEKHCTGCQLCVSACSNQILLPSGNLLTLMQPELSYEKGYCRPECVKCSEVCPTGAIKPITTADKSATQIGHAVWIKELCLPYNDEAICTNCQRHCPTGAITMVPKNDYDPDLKMPAIDNELCIGCGACENLCPSRPYSAMYVEGNLRHHLV